MAFSQWVKATISGEVEISGNTSDSYGGGIYVEWTPGTRPVDWVNLTITDSVRVTDNTAGTGGGGLYVAATLVEVTGSAVISGNTANIGGGVQMSSVTTGPTPHGATLNVNGDAQITGNTANNSAPSGGGVWADFNDDTLTAVAGSITGNTPDQCAGGTISC
ncbi:MAG: hypothetical protein ACR2J8_15330 [Thermomicrobiales bacterium]